SVGSAVPAIARRRLEAGDRLGYDRTRTMGAKLTMLFNLIRNWVAKTAAVAGAQPAPVEPGVVGLDAAEPLRHARALSEAGNVAAARRIYEEVLRRDRENSEAQYYLGVLLGRTGRL